MGAKVLSRRLNNRVVYKIEIKALKCFVQKIIKIKPTGLINRVDGLIDYEFLNKVFLDKFN